MTGAFRPSTFLEECVITKRGLVAAGALGVGSVLLATGSAFACNINDFSADSVAKCDVSTGTPKAAITVTDKDPSGTPADIIVHLRMADGRANGPIQGTAHIEHPTAEGVSVTILVDWYQGYQWIVEANAGNGKVDDYIATLPISPDTPCEVPASTSPTPTSSAPAGQPTASAPAVPVSADSSAPSPASSASGTVLAETGGGSDSGLIAGAAGALIIVGGGALFARRRRSARQN